MAASKQMNSCASKEVLPTRKKISPRACNCHHKPKTSSSGQNEQVTMNYPCMMKQQRTFLSCCVDDHGIACCGIVVVTELGMSKKGHDYFIC
jgi:hypothetical protein